MSPEGKRGPTSAARALSWRFSLLTPPSLPGSPGIFLQKKEGAKADTVNAGMQAGSRVKAVVCLMTFFMFSMWVSLVLFLSLAPFGGIKLSSSQENLSFRDMII